MLAQNSRMFLDTMNIALYCYYAYSIMNDEKNEVVGGMEMQLIKLARELQHRGHSVEFMVGDFGQPDTCESGGFMFHKIFDRSRSSLLRKISYFCRIIRTMQADIILERGSSDITGFLCLCAHALRKKYVFSAASDVNLVRDADDPSIRTGSRRWLFRYAIRNADNIIVQKKSQNELLSRSFGRRGKEIANMPLIAIDTVRAANGNNITWISNLNTYKRPDLCLDLARRLPAYSFVMAGAARDPRYYGEMEFLASSIPNVRFCGFVPPHKIPHLLAESRVLINTTIIDGKYEEGFPNAFLQAWSQGVPVVSLISNPDKIITEKGLGFCSGSIDRMADDLRLLMEDDTIHNAIARNCVTYMREYPDVSSIVDQYESLLKATLAHP